MDNSIVSILVNSCDKYVDAWEPFFRLLHIQWPDCPYNIFLNTESKKYECDFLNVSTICCGKNKSWSQRVKYALSLIDTDYVLFFLEDFFLMSPVNSYLLSNAVDEIQRNKRIGFISFNPDLDKALGYWKIDREYNEYYVYVSKKSKYRINAQANLWRKSFLNNVLKDNENAWEFEVYGTIRAKLMHQITLSRKIDSDKVFDYHTYQRFGYGINRGKWLQNNKSLFDKYAINVNFNNLGWYRKSNSQTRKKRTKKELIKLIYTNPIELLQIIKQKIQSKWLFLYAFFPVLKNKSLKNYNK